jgi:hypothetical protein|tara:strand:- start:525 stop:692 length:168 start_codon:yes stop_codon:yes gene_type:complete
MQIKIILDNGVMGANGCCKSGNESKAFTSGREMQIKKNNKSFEMFLFTLRMEVGA